VWLRIVVAAGVVMAALAGCAQGRSGSTAGTSDGGTGPLVSCGQVPTSTGPAAALVTVRVESPGTADAGAAIPVTATIDVHQAGPRIITRPTTSKVLVTQGQSVVGGMSSPEESHDIPVILTAGASRPAQAVPSHVTLTRCPPAGSATGAPLPPGTYGLVAVVSYGQDPLQGAVGGGSRAFQLVSDAAVIQVR
jgi:hypothetical protein